MEWYDQTFLSERLLWLQCGEQTRLGARPEALKMLEAYCNSLGKDKDDLGSGGRKTETGSNERVRKKGKPKVSNHVTPQNTDSVNIYRVPDTVCSSQQDRCRALPWWQLISDWCQSWKLYLCVLSPDPSLVRLPPDTPAQAHPVSYDSLCLLPLMAV